ncbi:hypothetical protein [Pedobacter sp. WC2423]
MEKTNEYTASNNYTVPNILVFEIAGLFFTHMSDIQSLEAF